MTQELVRTSASNAASVHRGDTLLLQRATSKRPRTTNELLSIEAEGTIKARACSLRASAARGELSYVRESRSFNHTEVGNLKFPLQSRLWIRF